MSFGEGSLRLAPALAPHMNFLTYLVFSTSFYHRYFNKDVSRLVTTASILMWQRNCSLHRRLYLLSLIITHCLSLPVCC